MSLKNGSRSYILSLGKEEKRRKEKISESGGA
jgi:hypothetical protein